MADFFDRLLAKSASAPAPRAADADGVRSAAAQPRLPHPFERPGTAGDLEWTEQPSSESEYSRRGNAMEQRSEPAFGPALEDPEQGLAQAEGPFEQGVRLCRLARRHFVEGMRSAAIGASGQHAPIHQIRILRDFVPNHGSGVVPPAHGIHEIQAQAAAHEFYM